MKETKQFKSSGFVYGNLWGGGRGAYPARKITAHTLEALTAEIDKGIKDGSLDSGMGYESLMGGVFDIETVTTATIKGKECSP